MKKIVALLLCLALLPLCGCDSSLAAEEKTDTRTAEEKTAETETEKTGEIVYPEGFAVGYARGDITGVLPMPYSGGMLTKIHDPLMLTVTALWDGEKAALIMSADLLQMTRSVHLQLCKILWEEFGIPEERVILSCTHTHTALTAGNETGSGTSWLVNFYKVFPVIVEEALRDLDEVEKVFGGKGTMEEGVTFVRRYLLPDGSFKTHGNPEAVAHESEADRELRTVRFERKSKKDVLLVNYQTHHGGAGRLYPDSVSADFVAPFREKAEEEFDCLFSYQCGAEGNLNFESPIPGERKYQTFPEAIPSFLAATREALEKETPLTLAPIRSASCDVVATVKKDSPERIAQAEEVSRAGGNEEEQKRLIEAFGFDSKYEAGGILRRNRELGDTEAVPLNCITCGDLAFAAFPYEMFDQSGKELRDASPYEMTLVNTLSGGSYGYMPTREAFPHGGYEVVVCPYTEGCAEEFVREMLQLLNSCK